MVLSVSLSKTKANKCFSAQLLYVAGKMQLTTGGKNFYAGPLLQDVQSLTGSTAGPTLAAVIRGPGVV